VREAAAHREPVEIITSHEAGACPALIVDGIEVAVPAGQDPEVVGIAVAAAEARWCGHCGSPRPSPPRTATTRCVRHLTDALGLAMLGMPIEGLVVAPLSN
jgi:hypothetical protein